MAMFGDFPGIRKQPSSPGSFWVAKGTVGCRLEGLLHLWAEEEGAVVMQ